MRSLETRLERDQRPQQLCRGILRVTVAMEWETYYQIAYWTWFSTLKSWCRTITRSVEIYSGSYPPQATGTPGIYSTNENDKLDNQYYRLNEQRRIHGHSRITLHKVRETNGGERRKGASLYPGYQQTTSAITNHLLWDIATPLETT